MKIIIFFFSFILISDAIDRQAEFEKNIIQIIGQKEAETLEKNCISVFGHSYYLVTRGDYILMTEHSSTHSLDCEKCISALTIENWKNLRSELVEVFPDYNDKPDLKVKRFHIFRRLAHFDLKNDLKKYPDLLTNLKEFPLRYFEKVDSSRLSTIKRLQNNDGSWGNKNKVECTSLALLSFLSTGHTVTSEFFGEAVKNGYIYLAKHSSNLKELEIPIYMWSMGEAYGMMGITLYGEALKTHLANFKKNRIKTKNFTKNKELFLLQNLFASSVYRDMEISFSDEKQRVASLKNKDPFAILCKLIWNSEVQLTKDDMDNISSNLKIGEANPLEHFVYICLKLHLEKNLDLNAYDKFVDQLINNKTFKFENKFTANEAKILNLSWGNIMYNLKNKYFVSTYFLRKK